MQKIDKDIIAKEDKSVGETENGLWKGLRYVNSDEPGYSRRKCGRGFICLNENGHRITDPATLSRIRDIGIPPVWENV